MNKKSSWYVKYTILIITAPFLMLGALWLLVRGGFKAGYELLDEYLKEHDP